MYTNLTQIIDMFIGEKCLTERKDEYGRINNSKNNHIHNRLINLKEAENFYSRLHILKSLKPYMEINEELLQYYHALNNTIHMDAINNSIEKINSKCDLIYSQIFAMSIMRGYEAEYVYSPHKSFVKDVSENLERFKSMISELYSQKYINIYIKKHSNILESILKRENAYNIVIEKIINSINEEAENLFKYKKSLINRQ